MQAADLSTRAKRTIVPGTPAASGETLAAVSKRYLRHQKRLLSPGSFRREDRIIALNLMPFFGGNTKLASIQKLDVQKYVKHRSGEVSPASTTKELNVLKHLLSLAVKWRLIPASPAQGIKAPPTPAGRIRYLQPAELRIVLESCPEWLRPIVGIAVATGMTRGEILRLRWRDTDLKCGRITIPQTKKKAERVVYLNDWAQDVLASIGQKGPTHTDYVFTGDSITPVNVSQAFLRACRSANVQNFCFRDLRHTTASWMVLQGVDVQTLSNILGHTDLRMTARYQHLSAGSISDAIKLLDRAFVRSAPNGVTKSTQLP